MRLELLGLVIQKKKRRSVGSYYRFPAKKQDPAPVARGYMDFHGKCILKIGDGLVLQRPKSSHLQGALGSALPHKCHIGQTSRCDRRHIAMSN